MDLFHHEILVATFFCSSHIPADMMDRRAVYFTIFIFYKNFIFGHFGNVSFFQDKVMLGVTYQCYHIRSNKRSFICMGSN